MERLQKFMSRSGVASRREAEEMIVAGRVKVNGKVVTELGTKVDSTTDRVLVDGKLIAADSFVYFMMHKPKGVITSVKDERGRKTVLDLMPDVTQRIYPVGRLDYNTEGLLLLTNDGELTNRLIHPKFKIYKTYIAVIHGLPEEERLDTLRVGMKLEDGMTAPAKVNVVDRDVEQRLTALEIVIHEGRYRQVRRMCEAIKCPVKSLKRVKFASLKLEDLRRGQYRELTKTELDALRSLTENGK